MPGILARAGRTGGAEGIAAWDSSVGVKPAAERREGCEHSTGYGASQCVGDDEVARAVRLEDTDAFKALQEPRRRRVKKLIEFALVGGGSTWSGAGARSGRPIVITATCSASTTKRSMSSPM